MKSKVRKVSTSLRLTVVLSMLMVLWSKPVHNIVFQIKCIVNFTIRKKILRLEYNKKIHSSIHPLYKYLES